MEQVILPKMYCPFPARINGHVEEAHEHTLGWVRRFGLVRKEEAQKRFVGARFAWLTARVYPTAGAEELALLNDWLVWLFLFDDQFDDSEPGRHLERVEAVIDEYIGFLTGARTSTGPAAEAFDDLCRRSFLDTSPAWKERFTGHLITYFETYIWTVGNRVLGIVPDMETYIGKRQHSGGMTIGIDLIEFAEGIELGTELLDSKAFRVLATTTNNVVCWSNDIFSLAKEQARGDVNNLVVIVQHREHLTLQEAVERVNAMVTEQVRLFEETERALQEMPEEMQGPVGAFIGGLKAWMRANVDWSLETKRYSQVEHTAPGETVSYVEGILGSGQQEGE